MKTTRVFYIPKFDQIFLEYGGKRIAKNEKQFTVYSEFGEFLLTWNDVVYVGTL